MIIVIFLDVVATVDVAGTEHKSQVTSAGHSLLYWLITEMSISPLS